MERAYGGNSDGLDSDAKVLAEASAIQGDTRAALRRIRQQASETQEVGSATLQELHNQRQQFYRISDAADRVEGQLKVTERLQNQLSRWTLNFNGRAARRVAQAETQFEKKKDETAQMRREIEASVGESETAKKSSDWATSIEVAQIGRTNQKSIASKKNKNDQPVIDIKPEPPKGLLYGSNNPAGVRPELQQLAEEDAEIDQELDGIGNQLDDLLQMAKTMGNEASRQSNHLDNFNGQMEKVNYQQKVVNNRTGRFLTGRVRRNYESESATSVTGFW